jgi:glycosyltransferase involved in cell wall biosynthesis
LGQNTVPRVSIITATYNRSDVLSCAIASVLAQTFQDWEQIIIGDACTDDTAEVVASFADPRIRFVNRETNFGEQSAPNNDGFALASGELIAYLNHDDLWFPDHLESLIAYLEETGADLVYALPFEVDRFGMPFCGTTNAELRYDPSHFVVASLWLTRRQLIEELGGWRAATEIHAVSPSQDLLTRAWQRGKDLRCYPRLTALFLASGGRPDAHNRRDSRQHEELLAKMVNPRMREELLTAYAMQSARTTQELRTQLGGPTARFGKLFDVLLKKLRLRPDAVRNALARRPKGWWVDHIRGVRGLGPLHRK